MSSAGHVYVVDDDQGVRAALDSLFRSVGYAVTAFASAADVASTKVFVRPGCVVLDIRMPGMSGLELQAELSSRDVAPPIVILTGHGDVPMCAQALKAGAVDFLLKPFREQDLLDAVSAGLARDRQALEASSERADLERRFASLSAREREVMALVVAGEPNKVIATRFQLSEITIKLSRGKVMRKMAASSLPDLVRIADRLNHRASPAADGASRSPHPRAQTGSAG